MEVIRVQKGPHQSKVGTSGPLKTRQQDCSTFYPNPETNGTCDLCRRHALPLPLFIDVSLSHKKTVLSNFSLWSCLFPALYQHTNSLILCLLLHKLCSVNTYPLCLSWCSSQTSLKLKHYSPWRPRNPALSRTIISSSRAWDEAINRFYHEWNSTPNPKWLLQLLPNHLFFIPNLIHLLHETNIIYSTQFPLKFSRNRYQSKKLQLRMAKKKQWSRAVRRDIYRLRNRTRWNTRIEQLSLRRRESSRSSLCHWRRKR